MLLNDLHNIHDMINDIVIAYIYDNIYFVRYNLYVYIPISKTKNH